LIYWAQIRLLNLGKQLRDRFTSGEGGDANYYLEAKINQDNGLITIEQTN
jgi:hypothetical protein